MKQCTCVCTSRHCLYMVCYATGMWPRLRMQIWDRDIFSANDSICETVISLKGTGKTEHSGRAGQPSGGQGRTGCASVWPVSALPCLLCPVLSCRCALSCPALPCLPCAQVSANRQCARRTVLRSSCMARTGLALLIYIFNVCARYLTAACRSHRIWLENLRHPNEEGSQVRVYVYVCMCACVRVRVYVRMYVVCVCVRVYVRVLHPHVYW